MKAIRAIKIILLVAAILCLLCTAVGNFFVLKDACDNGISAQEVHDKFEDYEFSFGKLFKAKAEQGEGTVPGDDASEADAETAAPAEDAENTQSDALEIADEGYKAGNHLGVLSSVMKLASGRMHFGFLDDLSFDLCKAGIVGIRGEEVTTQAADPENPENTVATTEIKPAFEVNTVLLIGVGCLTLAFILHLFTKNRRKTVWGILLMLFGYILFLGFFAFGQVLANIDINQLVKTPVEDFAAYRIYVVTGSMVLGGLMGLGFVRCGSRAMKKRRRNMDKHR